MLAVTPSLSPLSSRFYHKVHNSFTYLLDKRCLGVKPSKVKAIGQILLRIGRCTALVMKRTQSSCAISKPQ